MVLLYKCKSHKNERFRSRLFREEFTMESKHCELQNPLAECSFLAHVPIQSERHLNVTQCQRRHLREIFFFSLKLAKVYKALKNATYMRSFFLLVEDGETPVQSSPNEIVCDLLIRNNVSNRNAS